MKTSEVFGKIMNEDSTGLERHYKGRNSIPKSQDILYVSKHPKRRWNKHLHVEKYIGAPEAWSILPKHGHMPQVWEIRAKIAFCYF